MEKLRLKEMKISQDSISLDSYQTLAEYYLTVVDTKPFNAYYERPGTLALLPDVSGKTVLDAACAAGWYTNWLLEHGAQVTAVDFSPNMIAMTKRRVGDQAKIIQADLNQALDFINDASVDIVLSSLTLHYLKDWTTVLHEFYRILKKDGMMVFSVHHPFMDFTVFKRENYFLTELLNDEWDSSTGKVAVQFYRRPLNKIINAVLDAGFMIEKVAEPMPTSEFQKAQPEVYERLTQKPQFLFVRAGKM
jgi:ubiquinone/menaquinone biosynthesis C-methylase UbiE